jgi:hypothetical protein
MTSGFTRIAADGRLVLRPEEYRDDSLNSNSSSAPDSMLKIRMPGCAARLTR